MLRELTDPITFHEGFDSSSPLLGGSHQIMAAGSGNIIVTGTGKNEIFNNIALRSTIIGSKVAMNAGDGYAGLGDHSETGIGSVFKVLGALFYIGAGKLYWNGAYQSSSASTTLSLKKFTAGSLGAAFQVGLAQPSAPQIFAVTPPSGFVGKNNGVVSVKNARVRSQTGAVSNSSLASNIAQCTNQSVAITVASVDSNGQDYWEFDVTKNGEGGLGNHFFHSEVAESYIAATVSASTITDADDTITLPNGTLTASNIGWQYTSSGDTTTYVIAVGANDSGGAGRQLITLKAASVLTTTQSATFTRAVAGVLRTIILEWRDADLVGADLAPIRNLPPPAGVFGGVSGDVVFVDGCYGDTVNVTSQTDAQTGVAYSATTAGNAIAVSDPAKPESFPPDNYIFTGDSPTAIVPGGDGVHWRFALNSLGVIRYVGGSPALSYERVWTGIGIANQNHVTLGAGGRLYAITGARGLVRLGLGGEPDTAFAARIHESIKSLSISSIVLGADQNFGYVFLASDRTIYAYYEAQNIWCAPLKPSGISPKVIKSIVTVGGDAYFAYGDGSSIALYSFHTGTGTTGTIRTAWIPAAQVTEVVSRVIAAVTTDTVNTVVTIKTYTNGDTTTAKATQTRTLASTGFQFVPPVKPNTRAAKAYKIELSFANSGGQAGFESLRLAGEASNILQ